jgi:hypothetical protein
MGTHELFCLSWPWTSILPISASGQLGLQVWATTHSLGKNFNGKSTNRPGTTLRRQKCM